MDTKYVPPHLRKSGTPQSAQPARPQMNAGGFTCNSQTKNKDARGNRSDSDPWRTFQNRNARSAPQISQPAQKEAVEAPRIMKNKHNKPTEAPTSGALFNFLERGDFNTETSTMTNEIMDLQEDLKLPNKWLYWMEPESNLSIPSDPTREDFLQTLKVSRTFGSLQKIKNYAIQAFHSGFNAKICLFKQGVKPVWEDRVNYNGGRFSISCGSSTSALNSFLVLVIKFLCGQYNSRGEINGFVLKLQHNKFSVEIWNRNASEKDKIKMVRKNIKKIFKKNVMYHVHRTSIKIVKYGIGSVLPEIEKAESERQKKFQIEKLEKEKEKQKAEPQAIIEPEIKSVIEEVNKALVLVALENAWKSNQN